jgi:pimeloyl-ACP methyl ester carboxylesterase
VFKTEMVATNGTSLYVRVGGTGPAVVLLHGYGETGDMWAPLAAALVKDHTVVVPDLRGMGLSERPSGGYDKKTQGQDVAGLLDALKIGKVDLVTHDIGNMVGYAFAAEHPDRVTKFVIMDAPLPGVDPWDDIVRSHALWHFSFYGPDAERLVKGRERIYLDRFWNEFSADPKNFDEESREHYAALYARPGAMHAGFEQFKAFDQDASDNKALISAGKLTMPVLAIGGEKSFGPMMATVMHAAATNVTEAVVPNSGHWVMEENPTATSNPSAPRQGIKTASASRKIGRESSTLRSGVTGISKAQVRGLNRVNRALCPHAHARGGADSREFAEYVIRWIAWSIQNPAAPAEVALVLIGEKGAGKGTLVRCLERIFGAHAFEASMREHVIDKFNGHLQDCVLFIADEAYWGGDKRCVGRLQAMITEPTLSIERKGIDVIQVRNCLHVVMLAEPGWVIPAGRFERRYAALAVSTARRGDREYFRALHNQINNGGAEALFYDLLGMDLGD